MVLNRLQTVYIKWSNPIALENRANSCNYCAEEGLYIIFTRYLSHGEERERYIYVGETRKGFDIRFCQHLNERKPSPWVSVRGRKYVRFGKICNTPTCVNNLKWFLLTLETSIIQSIKDSPDVSLVNNRQVKDYTIYYDFIIENTGCRIVPKIISTRELYKVIDEYDNENIIGKLH